MEWQIQREHVRPFLFFLLFFFGVRALSLLDVTYTLPLLTTFPALLLAIGFAVVCYKRTALGFLLLLTEILLGSSGQFLELGGVTLRSIFLMLFFTIWGLRLALKKEPLPTLSRKWYGWLGATLTVVVLASIHGILQGHGANTVRQDATLYGFLLLALPASTYFSYTRTYITPLVSAYLVGTATFIAMTLARYSSGIGIIHDTYYKWFRDVVGGKITDLGLGMHRITTVDELLLVPIIIFLFGYALHGKKNTWYWLLVILALALLVVNLTRIYFLAIVVGAILLWSNKHIAAWMKAGVLFTAISTLSFIAIVMLVSGGASIGMHAIGLKAAPIVQESTDVSLATRALIWPEAKALLVANPILGHGLGTTITFIDPATNQSITRTQFDMGYVEQLVELGIVGLLVYLGCILAIGQGLFREHKSAHRYALAGLVALGVVNLTTPALFDGFGVVYISLCLGYAVQTCQRPHTT